MRLLLDTHALLWWLADDDRLGQQARDLLADPAQEVLVSVVSLWEIVVKLRVGKLMASLDDIVKAVGKSGFTRLDISVPHLHALAALPRHHRDPFDHLLMAQAIIEEAVFMSDDQNAQLYSIRTLACAGPSHVG